MDAHTSYYGEKYKLLHPALHMLKRGREGSGREGPGREEPVSSDEELGEITVLTGSGREGHNTDKMFNSKTKRQKTQDSIDEVTTNMSTVTVGKSKK